MNEMALLAIKQSVEEVINSSLFSGILIDKPGLDDACLKVGQQLLPGIITDKKQEEGARPIFYIATELYKTGGHTAVLESFIHAAPDEHHVIYLTDIFNRCEKEVIQTRFNYPYVEIVFCTEASLCEKVVALQKKWLSLNPKKIFLFNHHQDVVAISAALPSMPGKLYFYHHADFQLSLGTTLKHALHIDCNPLRYHLCRVTHDDKNVYLPLDCEDLGVPPEREFMKEGVINTASSGSPYKFLQPYAYSYLELLPSIMQITRGTHTHIGPLPPESLESLHQSLELAGIDPQRFLHIAHVKSVWSALQEHHSDLYLTSFPIAGGRTAVEVMGAGIPVLCHQNYRSPLLSEHHLLYPEALSWKTPPELLSVLKEVTPSLLLKHSALARKQYETYHCASYLKERMAADFERCFDLPIPPPCDTFTSHSTQLFLDLNAEMSRLKDETNRHNDEINKLNKKYRDIEWGGLKRYVRWVYRYLRAKMERT